MNLSERILRKTCTLAFRALQALGSMVSQASPAIALVPAAMPEDEREDFLRRLRFYLPESACEIEFRNELDLRALFSARPVLIFGGNPPRQWWTTLRAAVFDVDPRHNPLDGWAWSHLTKTGQVPGPVALAAETRLRECIASLRARGLDRAYIFGTGVSLAQAIDRDWSDGYRIVCNTIVRDARLWRHIDPHFIVAGDAIYHFGFTPFAKQFRADLAKRLGETNTFFVYPDLFNEIVVREFGAFEDRLIPIPDGKHFDVHVDLTKYFYLPMLGNVLSNLLLPLACTLSKKVYLWGFDGRAPDDKLFWSNSSQHSYPELMRFLQEAHPAFFAHYVPADKPGEYVKNVHGEKLENALRSAESEGWHFVMMHKSWTPTLAKRCPSNI